MFENTNIFIILNYSRDTLRMFCHHFFSRDENGKIYGHGWNANMADIEITFERRVFWDTI